jgi:cAMP phosphodiesterase
MKRYRVVAIFFALWGILSFPGLTGYGQVGKGSGDAVGSGDVFYVVPLGVKGGLDESNLSAYLVAARGNYDYVCLDAGTLRFGLKKATDSGLFDEAYGFQGQNPGHGRDRPTADFVMRHFIRAYLISHPHLDHIAGLIINSPEDSAKNIYGLSFCLEVLRDHYFTWKTWANFADQGDRPALGKYHYVPLTVGQETAIAHTALFVTAFPLSHSKPNQSTAFLLRSGDAFLLYLGDTGSDELEESDKLHQLWKSVAPLIRAGKLKAIFIEVSFPNAQPEKSLFGHLTPRLLVRELNKLDSLAGKGSLKGFPIVVTHIKPSGDQEASIKKELAAENPLEVQWIFPEQAKALSF